MKKLNLLLPAAVSLLIGCQSAPKAETKAAIDYFSSSQVSAAPFLGNEAIIWGGASGQSHIKVCNQKSFEQENVICAPAKGTTQTTVSTKHLRQHFYEAVRIFAGDGVIARSKFRALTFLDFVCGASVEKESACVAQTQNISALKKVRVEIQQLKEFEGAEPAIYSINTQLGKIVDNWFLDVETRLRVIPKTDVFAYEVLRSYAGVIDEPDGFLKVKGSQAEFLMGSPESEEDRDPDETQHRVRVEKDFYLQKTEVTQRLWFEVMGYLRSNFVCRDRTRRSCKAQESFCPESYIEKGATGMCPNYPVDTISKTEIEIFLINLTEKSGVYQYRLPSEIEWEYAARAGTTTKYATGDKLSDLESHGWFANNSGNTAFKKMQPHNVAKLKPNNWGFYDMHGNVWEWVQDVYRDQPVTNQPPVERVPSEDGEVRYVRRGGGWYCEAQWVRVANRGHDPAGSRYPWVGFRTVRDRN